MLDINESKLKVAAAAFDEHGTGTVELTELQSTCLKEVFRASEFAARRPVTACAIAGVGLASTAYVGFKIVRKIFS